MIYGYFTDPSETTPSYDPGLGAPCPICLRTLADRPVVTTSLMLPGDRRSFFFRAHQDCWRGASEEERAQIEGALIDALPTSATAELLKR